MLVMRMRVQGGVSESESESEPGSISIQEGGDEGGGTRVDAAAAKHAPAWCPTNEASSGVACARFELNNHGWRVESRWREGGVEVVCMGPDAVCACARPVNRYMARVEGRCGAWRLREEGALPSSTEPIYRNMGSSGG